MNAFPAILSLLCLLIAASRAQEGSAQDLTPLLETSLKESKLPALAAAAVSATELKGIGATGLRQLGESATVSINDKFHLGSCTKPMTATLTAILIEDGLLKWDTTIQEVLGLKIRKLHPDYENVTVEQLLAHVGGLDRTPPPAFWAQAFADQGKKSATKQRLDYVTSILTQAPNYSPGTTTEYSNQGYAVVGVMLETLSKKPWEFLMKERLFQPLGMTSAGFRAPCSPQSLDHPWGHTTDGKPVAPEPQGDNPDAIGPAGTVHASIGDWAKFAQFHLQRKPGSLLKHAASFDKLHTTLANSGTHGVGGWLVHDMEHLGGHCVQMIGSNTMWMAHLWIVPERQIAVVVASNSAQKQASPLCDQIAGQLIRQFGQE